VFTVLSAWARRSAAGTAPTKGRSALARPADVSRRTPLPRGATMYTKRFFMRTGVTVGVFALVLSSGVSLVTASADDLGAPAPAPIYTEAPVAVPSWTDFYIGYIGGNVGGVWHPVSQSFSQTNTPNRPQTTPSTNVQGPPDQTLPVVKAHAWQFAPTSPGHVSSIGTTFSETSWVAGALIEHRIDIIEDPTDRIGGRLVEGAAVAPRTFPGPIILRKCPSPKFCMRSGLARAAICYDS
jgi:hypothetical protein